MVEVKNDQMKFKESKIVHRPLHTFFFECAPYVIPLKGLCVCLQGAEHCAECRNFQDGDLCVDHCPSGVKEDQQTVWKYSNATGHCLPCNTNCTLS